MAPNRKFIKYEKIVKKITCYRTIPDVVGSTHYFQHTSEFQGRESGVYSEIEYLKWEKVVCRRLNDEF